MTAWPIASLLGAPILGWRLRPPESTLVPLLVAASLAGLILGLSAADRPASRQKPLETASTRAGFIAAIIAAALLVTRATWLYGSPGRMSEPALTTLFIALVAVLPATLCARFMAGVGRALRLALEADPTSGRDAFTLQPIYGLVLLCALGLLSPFLPALFRALPQPNAFEGHAAPAALQAPAPLTPFSYKAPDGFALASAAHLAVLDTRTLSQIDTAKPMSLSPDGRWFAFHLLAQSPPTLALWNLDTFSESARIECSAHATSLAWSPDTKRLIGLFPDREGRSLAVVAPEQRRLIRLPRPESQDLPEGTLAWPEPADIVLHPSSGRPLALNLDTLEWRPLEEAAFFNTLSRSRQQRVSAPPTVALPNTLKWVFGAGWALRSAGPYLFGDQRSWKRYAVPSLIAIDLEQGTRRHLPELPIQADSRVLFAPDGSKAILVQGHTASVKYLGLRDLPKVLFRIDTKRSVEDFPLSDALKQALSEGRLYACVYPPLINPLNQQTVGADSTAVKAMVRLRSWVKTRAEVAVQDEFAPTNAGDVVSALHTWEEGAPKRVTDEAPFAWWATIADEGAAMPGGRGIMNERPAPDIGPPLVLQSNGGGFAIEERPRAQTFYPSIRPVGSAFPAQQVPPSPPAPLPTPMPTPAPAREPDPLLREHAVAAFIHEHHRKSSNGDIDGLMEDYLEQVEHYKAGLVSRARIRSEEEKYHAPGYAISEKVRGQIRQVLLSPGLVRVQYELQFLRTAPDRSWTKGAADVTLEIEATALGLRIAMQNSTSRENEKQRGRGAPPSL